MAAVLKLIYKYYHELMDVFSDPRTEHFFLSQNILMPVSIGLVYLLFVKKWGPQLMKDRPAYKLNIIVAAYNLLQICFSARFFYLGFTRVYVLGPYKFQCEPVDFSQSRMGLFVANEVHNFYLLKLLDLMDTVFFVLRKKYKQVTFLHVYHHLAMVIGTWIAVRFVPGGHGLFVGFVNAFVHMVMYSYYLFTIFNNSSRIWWKKYLTILQILQFFLMTVQWAVMVFGPSCGYPKMLGLLFLPQNTFMIFMFMEFYYKAYIKNK